MVTNIMVFFFVEICYDLSAIFQGPFLGCVMFAWDVISHTNLTTHAYLQEPDYELQHHKYDNLGCCLALLCCFHEHTSYVKTHSLSAHSRILVVYAQAGSTIFSCNKKDHTNTILKENFSICLSHYRI